MTIANARRPDLEASSAWPEQPDASSIELQQVQRALLNIVEDAVDERNRRDAIQRAMLNILDDAHEEKTLVEDGQKALLNILDDLEEEKSSIERTNVELQRAIEEHLLAEKALRERTADLARSNDDLEMFAYAASHDLSEPLRAISLPISLLARRFAGQMGSDADELIEFAVDGCRRMQTLIDDLLTYSRVGRVEGAMQPVDCDEVATSVLASLAASIEAAGARVDLGPLPVVVVERTQFGQLLQNLVSNALKFSGAESPAVTIAAEREGASWRFSVTDNGIGVPEAHRERIFGLFKRLHTRDEYPGTGIGLAVTKKIVERHGGEVGVSDNPDGDGSCFWFTLPASPGGAT